MIDLADNDGLFRQRGKLGSWKRFVTWSEIVDRGIHEIVLCDYTNREHAGFLQVSESEERRVAQVCAAFGWTPERAREVFSH